MAGNTDASCSTTPASEKTKEELEEKETAKKIKAVNTACRVIRNTLKRQQATTDPSIKYSMLVDKLCLSLDVGLGALWTLVDDLPEETRKNCESLCDEIQNDLAGLMQWIQNPSYSPDHPHGNGMMKDAEEHFSNNTSGSE